MSVVVEAIDLDPVDLGKLTFSVTNPLFAIRQNANSKTAEIIVNK